MTTDRYRKYLNPETLSKVSGLELRARHVVEGYLVGMHRSPYHGLDVEFAEHRPYTPGAELKRIDWKLWARSDRFYVKLFEEETNLRAHFLMDGSHSMAYSSGPMSKYDYGATVAASLAYILLMQQDAVGLRLFDSARRAVLEPRATEAQIDPFCRVLATHEPSGQTDMGAPLQQVAARLGRRGLVVLISDMLAPLADLRAALRRFTYDGHAVVFAHVVDAAEVDFPFDGQLHFEGLEAGPDVRTDARQVRGRYLEAFQRFCRELAKECSERGADYVRLRTDRRLDVALSRFLSTRAPL